MAINPSPGEVELVLLAGLQPRVWPQVDCAEVKLGNGMVSEEVASLQDKNFCSTASTDHTNPNA